MTMGFCARPYKPGKVLFPFIALTLASLAGQALVFLKQEAIEPGFYGKVWQIYDDRCDRWGVIWCCAGVILKQSSPIW